MKMHIAGHGASHTGHLRQENEDVFVIEPELGLYAVFDGMGGHMAGDVAAGTARDIVVRSVRERPDEPVEEVLRDALGEAARSIHAQAADRRDRHGMGTTAVIARICADRAVIAHVGDSRAYRLRGPKLEPLTADHTVVSAMLAAGAITPEEALHHPYKNVLSRCVGNHETVEVEVQTVSLRAGDRLLLCSDGLTGYASREAIEQVLRGAENPRLAADDLIELALKGGGGDNVTAVAVFAGEAVIPQATVILRDSGASEWWRRRDRFMSEARALGVASSPICAKLPAEEALDIVAGNLCEAIFRDLEQTASIHSWTYAESLASGWIDQGGDYPALGDLLARLTQAAQSVLADITANASFAAVLEVEVTRALIVAESAVAGVLADRLRRLEAQLMSTHEEGFRPRADTEQPTVPYLGGPRTETPSAEVLAILVEVQKAALRSAGVDSSPLAQRCLRAAHELAAEPVGGAEILDAARELHGSHEQGTMPLFEALDVARVQHLRRVKLSPAPLDPRALAMRRLASSYQSLAHAVAVLVVDAGRPISDQLRELAEQTGRMREQVRRGEVRVAELEARLQGATAIEGAP